MKILSNLSTNTPLMEVTFDTQASWDEVTMSQQEDDSVTTPSVEM